MMPVKRLIDIVLPEKTERVQIEITKVHDDGSYEYRGIGCGGRSSSPVYDENGDPADIAVDTNADADMLAALKILLGGE